MSFLCCVPDINIIWINPCLQPEKSKFWKNEKMHGDIIILHGDIIILHMCTINDNHMVYTSWNIEHDRQIFVILDRFLPFYPPNNPKNQNSEKMKMYRFTPVYHKLQSYDACFLRYRAQWTDFFVILDHSLPFYPITTRKIKI